MSTLLLEDVESDAQRERRYARDAEGDDRASRGCSERAHAGDDAARTALIERFLPLARSLARRYIRSAESADDLLQVASLALVKAVDRFDPDRGVGVLDVRRRRRSSASSSATSATPRGRCTCRARCPSAWPRGEGRARAGQQDCGRKPSVAEIAERWARSRVGGQRPRRQPGRTTRSRSTRRSTRRRRGETLAATLGERGRAASSYVEDRDAVAGVAAPARRRASARCCELRFGAEMTQSRDRRADRRVADAGLAHPAAHARPSPHALRRAAELIAKSRRPPQRRSTEPDRLTGSSGRRTR